MRPRAVEQIDDSYRWWATHRSAEQAARWHRGIEKAILGLGRNPERHALATENDLLPIEVRQMLYGLGRRPSHRVLFTIRPDCVYVLAIVHVAPDAIGLDDL
jgi:plasmid stabilization system protein ParE